MALKKKKKIFLRHPGKSSEKRVKEYKLLDFLTNNTEI